jgi:putative membrane protein
VSARNRIITVAPILVALMLAAAVTTASAAESIQSIVGSPMMHHMRRPSPAWVFVLAVVMAAGYAAAIYKLKRQPEWWQTACFFGSLALAVVVVAGPLDRLAWDRAFVAYIAEQILLYLVAAPLLLLGLPEWMARPAVTKFRMRGVVKFLSKPLIAFGSFSLLFVGIHFPYVCNMICHARPFFIGIRAALLAVGVVLWLPILNPLSEFTMARPLQVLYLFLLIIPMTAVAAPITYSHSLIYTWLEGPPVLGLSPLTQQRLGGILMWVGQALIIVIAASMIFLRWVNEEGEGDTEGDTIDHPRVGVRAR